MTDLSKIEPLKHENLQSAVYSKLCDLILQGGLVPGKSVTVASLSDALNVSPMPIREAMLRLVHAGALTRVSGRSMGVPKLSALELEELKNVRIEIECLAVSWAMEHVTPDFCAHLGVLFDNLVSAERRQNNEQFITLNYQFHFAIYKQSGSQILVEIIRNLWLRITPYFHLLDAKGHLHISNELHSELIRHIKARSKAEAMEAVKQDIERAYEKLVEHT